MRQPWKIKARGYKNYMQKTQLNHPLKTYNKISALKYQLNWILAENISRGFIFTKQAYLFVRNIHKNTQLRDPE